MNLYLMIAHLSMLVFGVDSKKKLINYSGIHFVADQNASFAVDYQNVCKIFNYICTLNIDYMANYIIEYSAEFLKVKIISKESSIKEFDNNFYNISRFYELELSYLFLNKLLEANKINISDVFDAAKERLNEWASKTITNVEKMIQLNEKYHSKDPRYNKEQEYMVSVLEIIPLINDSKLTNNNGCGCVLIERITDFLKKYHEYVSSTEILSNLKPKIYNSFMLFLTILRLDDAVNEQPRDCLSKNSCHQKIDVKSIKNLINKLSVETFMFLARFDEFFIDEMKRCIEPSNLRFWRKFNLLSVFPPARIINVDFLNLMNELTLLITNFIKNMDDSEDLITYKILLEKSKAILLNVINKGDKYLNVHPYLKEGYSDLHEKINVAILQVNNLLEKANLIGN